MLGVCKKRCATMLTSCESANATYDDGDSTEADISKVTESLPGVHVSRKLQDAVSQSSGSCKQLFDWPHPLTSISSPRHVCSRATILSHVVVMCLLCIFCAPASGWWSAAERKKSTLHIQPLYIAKTRSSAIAVIADRTACSILTLFIVSTTSRPVNKKSVRESN